MTKVTGLKAYGLLNIPPLHTVNQLHGVTEMGYRTPGTKDDRKNGEFLNGQLCAATDLAALAGKSAWLQYYHVMLTVAHVVLMQKRFSTAPTFTVSAAKYQLLMGQTSNPYAHVVPCTILVNGTAMPELYSSDKAKKELQRIFGLGVMAPAGTLGPANGPAIHWADSRPPLLVNQADSAVEHHGEIDGLCEALRYTLEVAAGRTAWKGAGDQRSSDETFVQIVRYADMLIWRPYMAFAYNSAISRMGTIIAGSVDPAARTRRQGRQDVLRTKLRMHEASWGKINYWTLLGQAMGALEDEPANVRVVSP